MKKFFIYTVFLLTIVFPGLAGAKTLYVDPNGNDSVTYTNNSITSPWRTIGRATWGSTSRTSPNSSEAAKAGDTVIVNAGTYVTSGTGNRFDPSYNPVNSGVAGNPITFVSNGVVNLQLNSSAGPVIGTNGKNYIVWDGFTINETSALSVPDTGPVVVIGSQGVVIKNMKLYGITAAWDDNHNGVRVEQSNGTIVQGNFMTGFGSASGRGQNDATIMLYDSNDTLIQNNELSNSGLGVFIKGQHPGFTQRRNIIRYNLIYGMAAQGITIGPAARDGMTYQNIIRDCTSDTAGIKIYDFGSTEGTEPINEIVTNNTIDNCAYGIQFMGSGQNVRVVNNIITNSRASIWSWTDSNPAGLTFERNNYFNFSNFAELSDGNKTLSTWRTSFSKDLSSVTSDPLYVNRTSKDFHLQPSSPIRSLAQDIIDLNQNGSITDVIPAGAYITGNEIIGVGGTNTATPIIPVTPSSTADLKVNAGDVGVTVNSGTSITLSWTSSNATSCSLTGGYSGTTGTQTVTPITNTTYTLNCLGAGGNSSDSIVVTINTITIPTDATWTFCANENAQCLFTGTKEVRYGANNTYSYLTLTGGTTCSNNVFGDPVLNVVKQCYYRDTNSNVDTTVPIVSITSPANSSNVLGTITVIATASDNTGVSGVQFKVNNSNLGMEDTVSPYSYSLDTTTLLNGTQTIYAVARDSAGNRATSTISVNVNNQSQSIPTPTADIQLNGSNSSQTVTVGTSLTLTWTSTNSTSCLVTPGNFTGTSGTQTVTPESSTTYTLNCSGNGGSASDSIAVTANTVVVPPTDTGSTVIKIGDRVIINATVNIRKTPGGKILGYQRNGSTGVVTDGPTNSGGRSWYKINYSSGVDGWTASSFLSKAGTTTLSRQEIENQIANILIIIKQLQEQLSKLR
jgi:hypothetical protein